MSEELTNYVTHVFGFGIVIVIEKYVVYCFVIRC